MSVPHPCARHIRGVLPAMMACAICGLTQGHFDQVILVEHNATLLAGVPCKFHLHDADGGGVQVQIAR